MNTVYVDSDVNDDIRRQRLYAGQLFVISPRPSTDRIVRVCKEHDPGGVRLSGSARSAVSHAS